MSEEASLDEFIKEIRSDNQRATLRLGPKQVNIPESWEVSTLEEVNDPDSPIGYGVVKPGKDIEDGTPLVKIEDVIDGYLTPEQDFHQITDEKDEKYSRSRLSGGEVLVSIQGTVGNSIIAPSRMAGANISRTIARVTPEQPNNQWIKYYIQLKPVQDYIEVVSSGSTRASYNIGDIRKTNVALPPLSEQRKIATVLYTVDQAVEKTEGVIDQISTVKEGVKDDLLTGGLGDAETTETRLGPVSTKIPTHWDTGRIEDLFTDRQLGTDERGTTEDGENIALIKMGNLDFGTWDLSEVEEIERDPKLLKEAGLQRGDLLFNTRNTPELVGKTAVWEFDHEAVYDNNLLRLRFGERISSGHFVNAYLSSNIGRRQLRGRVHGTTSVAAIYWTDLQQVEIPVPPKEEQREIIDALQELDRTRKHNESYRSSLQRLKQGLMQDLLSGKTRTTDTNIDVPEEITQYG